MRLVPFPALLAVLALALAVCGAPAAPTPPPGSITVELMEWQVVPATTNLSAGSVTFFVKNSGSSAHDLTILKTNLPEAGIPQEAGKAREDGRVAKTDPINPGSSVTLTVTLAAGDYVFLCNEPGHYALGMHLHVSVK